MIASRAKVVLVPGAWMGGWVWEPAAEALRSRGLDAETITLKGLGPGESDADIAAVRLDDHVQQLVDHVHRGSSRPAVLVSHSYSGMVTASAADRLGEQVSGLIHLGAFVPRPGRSLLDDWGGSDDERAQERADIEAAGNLWHAPTREMLDYETDLSPRDRDRLASKFTAHPGRTVLDPAQLSEPAERQPSTYVALTPHGGFDEAWMGAPKIAKAAAGWRREHILSGHWPMVSALDATVDVLESEIRHYSAESR
ncbi:alpha/beta hydrolase [Demequina muriae]|uniref:Alpha/beta hydrolase n=1 Tax=Demequina muriae TaxID=3051664 RepID=A0ABT8GF02_9MICO|nr:alpha/beta hydrolase [Demequina sp. EGI L300058]MDN4480014.1 alpha/beta hydrolase [Demequina sp. EGI L300058]